jgi:hypothetical protein
VPFVTEFPAPTIFLPLFLEVPGIEVAPAVPAVPLPTALPLSIGVLGEVRVVVPALPTPVAERPLPTLGVVVIPGLPTPVAERPLPAGGVVVVPGLPTPVAERPLPTVGVVVIPGLPTPVAVRPLSTLGVTVAGAGSRLGIWACGPAVPSPVAPGEPTRGFGLRSLASGSVGRMTGPPLPGFVALGFVGPESIVPLRSIVAPVRSGVRQRVMPVWPMSPCSQGLLCWLNAGWLRMSSVDVAMIHFMAVSFRVQARFRETRLFV